MAKLTITGLDEAVIEVLRERAKAHGHSLQDEVRQILAQAVGPPRADNPRAVADRIAAMIPDVPQTDSAELLRQDRER
ncbi:MAG: hypothetical protein QF398_06710 [Alphaproteobacteria bacterium]|jgi:plasmid stability protein|nr:hypothetical protein [Alphaproteobacteria bacterium]